MDYRSLGRAAAVVAIEEVDNFVYNRFGFSIVDECNKDTISNIDDQILYFEKTYGIVFDENGYIDTFTDITNKDRARECVRFYDEFLDRPDKDFDTLDIAMDVLRDYLAE